jgi:phasin family protein
MRKSSMTNTKHGAPQVKRNGRTTSTARTVRAAAANTSERISGSAQDTLLEGVNTAAESTRRMADQVTQLFGLTGKQQDEFARRSAQSVEAMSQASTAVTRGLQDLSRELMTVAQEQIRRNVEALGRLSHARSVQELITVQSELLRDNLQQMMESTRRMAEVSSRMADEATRTMAQQAREGSQRRAA